MADNVIRREVHRRDDPFGIPACFYWTVDEVADWVDSIGYGKYKENFRSHFINGRKLLTVDSCVLPKMGITHFGDILSLSKIIQRIGECRVCVTQDFRPKPPPIPTRLCDIQRQQQCQYEPWCTQPQHQTFVDYVKTQSRAQAARLANQSQYYMSA